MLHSKLIIAVVTTIITTQANATEQSQPGGTASPYATPDLQAGQESRNRPIDATVQIAATAPIADKNKASTPNTTPADAGPAALRNRANAGVPKPQQPN